MDPNFNVYSNEKLISIVFVFCFIVWFLIILFLLFYFDFYLLNLTLISLIIITFISITFFFFNIRFLEIYISDIGVNILYTNFLFKLIGKKYNFSKYIDFMFIEEIEISHVFFLKLTMSTILNKKKIMIPLLFFKRKDILTIYNNIKFNKHNSDNAGKNMQNCKTIN